MTNVNTRSMDYTKTQSADCSTFYDKFSNNLSVQKVCRGNSKSDGCIPTYVSYSVSSGCTGFSQNSVNNINYPYVLSDGMIIITYGAKSSPLFLFDINGHKGPNAYGKDLFSFNISISSDDLTKYFLEPQACDYPVQGGKDTRTMMRTAFK